MPKFFIDKSSLAEGKAILTGEKAQHITKSLRMTPGEHVILCDGCGTDHFCVIDSVGKEVSLTVENFHPSIAEPPYKAVIYQGLSKGDRFDTVVQKSVECGAFAIVPVQTERATVRLSKDECDKKNIRWQRIAESAAEQCGRGIVPEMRRLMSFTEAVAEAALADLALFCYENEDGVTLKERLDAFAASVRSGNGVPEIAVLIGPEGGFSEKEASLAREVCASSGNFHSVSLGPRILRTESAAPFALACISMALEL